MKLIHILIICCTLVAAGVQSAAARQGLEHGPLARAPMMGGDPLTTDAILTDSMVLPLVGASDHVEGRLAFAKTELQITPAQLPLWNAFAAAARMNAQQENALMSQMSSMIEGAAPSLPQRLDAHEKRLAIHLKMLQRVKAALLPLYASFSNEQKRTADALAYGPTGL
jgi:LTXXQ motif family protein